jgi:hypothetical protein
MPVFPLHTPFQLQAIGPRVFPLIPAQACAIEAFGICHIIQSKHPPLGPMIDQANVPAELVFIVMKVELVSPLNKQPELKPCGFVEGLEILPEVKSITLVAGLFGAMGNAGVVQPGTASEQSFG